MTNFFDLENFLGEVENLKLYIKVLEERNKKLKEVNKKLNEELDMVYGKEIDTFSLNKVTKSSELIKTIEERYKNANMKVVKCQPNRDGKTFALQFGEWSWNGKIIFVGKQYFQKKRFSSVDIDGYDDPTKFICEILGIKDLGNGGIAKNWYRLNIPIPNGFEFDYYFDKT